MKKKNKIIILSSLIIVMVVALTYVVTNIGAWLTDQKDTGDVTITVGEVSYVLSGNPFSGIGENDFVVPGQNLAKDNDLTIKNNSNVASNLRIKIEFTYDNADAMEYVSLITLGSDWTSLKGEFYYLENEDEEAGRIEANEFTSEIDIITHLVLDGAKVGNDFSNKQFTIKITFQAKQADHLTWEDAGSLDFTTGLKD